LSASFVSCRQTTSGRRSSNQGSSRGTRCLTELTFQVAIRTDLKVPTPPGFAGSALAVIPHGTDEASEAGFRHVIAGADASSTLRPFAVSETSMLPRVAFEYGHTWCAACTSFSVASRSQPGTLICIAT